MPFKPPDGLISARQAARILGLTPHAVAVEAAAGLIQARAEVGRPLLFDRASVLRRARELGRAVAAGETRS